MRLDKARKSSNLDVRGALYAICSTGKGRCWHCDRKLPTVEEAIGGGWYVERVNGQRVASIILVCPKCRQKQAARDAKRYMRNLSPAVSNTVQ